MQKPTTVYTKEDKAVYKMAQAMHLRLEESKSDTLIEEHVLTQAVELIKKLRIILVKLDGSDNFSHSMLAIDVKYEIDMLAIYCRYERAKLIDNRNYLAKLRSDAISKLAYIRQLCDEANEIYSKGLVKFNNGDFTKAVDDYKSAISYYNNSRHLIGQLVSMRADLPLYESTIDVLSKLRSILNPICVANYKSLDDTVYLKSDADLKILLKSADIAGTTKNEASAQVFNKDLFVHQIGTISYNRQSISTNFTDEQAINVCSKMSDNYARHVAAKYRQYIGKIQGGIYRYHLHCLANKALGFYGGPVLTFLLGLRPLKFSNSSAYAINFQNPSSDILRVSVDFPVLTFTTLKGEKYTLAFHLVHNHPAQQFKRNVRIFKKGVQVGAIDKRGFVLDVYGDLLKKLNSADSSLLTFCCFLADSKNPAFYSGVETGNCFMCERKLTDPISIRYGIGPVCLGKAIY